MSGASTSRPKRTRLRATGDAPVLPDAHYREICETLDHKFRDRSLIDRAFTHPSALSGRNGGLASNQRLEFLGDRVLGLVIAERLFTRRRTEREGDLAPRLNRLVNKKACADAMKHVGLGKFVIMSTHEIAMGGRERESTLGDLCESVIAALYLDSGITKARKFIEQAFAPQFTEMATSAKDAKTHLQEWAQASGKGLPHYRMIDRSGPDHAPRFIVEAKLNDGQSARGAASSKREAERIAAELLLQANLDTHD